MIVTEAFRPGDRLPPERDLAADLGVSRTSLREAMFELEQKKLIERHQGRGSIVAPRSRSAAELLDNLSVIDAELGNAVELRDIVEPRIAQLAARRAVESNIVALTEVLESSTEDLESAESIALDVEFHNLLARAAQNPLLVTLCSMTASWTERTRELSHSSALGRRISIEGHRSILAAVVARDADAAGAAMERHLREVKEIGLRRL